MQTSPGSQINWLQRHPLSPGGRTGSTSLPAPAAPACSPGLGFWGAKHQDPGPPGHPRQAARFPSVRSPLLTPLLAFVFLFILPFTVIPTTFLKFLLCVSPPDSHGLALGEGECKRVAGRARGYLHFTCRIWSLRLAWM